MPLGLYTPLVTGIGSLNSEILFPTGIGALLTVVLLAKAVNCLMENYYSIAFMESSASPWRPDGL